MNKTQFIPGGMHRRGMSPKRTGQIIINSGTQNPQNLPQNNRAKSSGGGQYENMYNNPSSAAPASGVNTSLNQIPKKPTSINPATQGKIPIRQPKKSMGQT
jgi:hypothetical protein